MITFRTTHEGRTVYEAKTKKLESLNLVTYIGRGASFAEAMTECATKATCTHDYRANEAMRLRKCMKCKHTEYYR